jgi:hypothetical protein
MFMNELQRQAYLNAMSLESYFPRWIMPWAPPSQACVRDWSESAGKVALNDLDVLQGASNLQADIVSREKQSPLAVAEVLQKLDLKPVRQKQQPYIVSQQQAATSQRIVPFALSIWRPFANWLVIDERQPQAALPVEILLHNILRSFGVVQSTLAEEVLRWPLVENKVVHQTIFHARQALTVWLEVELEQRPVDKLLLMGHKSAELFLPEGVSFEDGIWNVCDLSLPNLQALVTPSLVDLLRNPQLKVGLWRAMSNFGVSR